MKINSFCIALLIIIFCFNNSFASDKLSSDEITVYFKTFNSDSIGFPWMGWDWLANISLLPTEEKIIDLPDGFKMSETFFINIQPNQYFLNLSRRSQNDYEKVINILGQKYFDEISSNYTEKVVDCIITICIVKNNNDEEYVIIDQNNDEILSNDKVLNYIDGNFEYGHRIIKTKFVNTNADVEYFDGNTIQKCNLPIRFRKVFAKNGIHPEYSILQNEIGEIAINDKIYKIGLLNNVEIEYSKFNLLWLDVDQNNKRNESDCTVQMNQPFTLLGETYELIHLDRFGKELTIKKSSAKVNPAISKGLPAPEFKAITIDSNRFQLSDMKGKYILLDFWGSWCGPCNAEIPFLKKVYDKYKSNNFEIVGIGIDDPIKLKSFIKKNKMDWIHIQQNKDSELVKLYQVGAYPTSFLINPKGEIIALSNDLRGEYLIQTLETLVK